MIAAYREDLSPEASAARAPSAATFDHAQPPVVPGPLRRGAIIAGDFIGVVGVALCIPFAILAIGIPIALCLRLLLWIAGMF